MTFRIGIETILFLAAAMLPLLSPPLPSGETAPGSDMRKPRELSDLNESVIGILVGTFMDKTAERHIDLVTIEFYDDYDAMEESLLAGDIDAIFGDEPVMRQRMANNPEKLRVMDEIMDVSQYGFAFRHGSQQLHSQFNAVMKELHRDGTLDRLVEKWTTGGGMERVVEESSAGCSGPVLHLGTNGVLPPFTYIDGDGRPTGMDIEMAEIIARRLDRPLKITVMEFGEMIPTLIAGGVDMIGGAVTITADRAKVIRFADGYYSIGVAALVRR